MKRHFLKIHLYFDRVPRLFTVRIGKKLSKGRIDPKDISKCYKVLVQNFLCTGSRKNEEKLKRGTKTTLFKMRNIYLRRDHVFQQPMTHSSLSSR